MLLVAIVQALYVISESDVQIENELIEERLVYGRQQRDWDGYEEEYDLDAEEYPEDDPDKVRIRQVDDEDIDVY